jgi:outer membrane protein assembly factor BamD
MMLVIIIQGPFEQIAPAYRGETQREIVCHCSAQSYYKTKQYYFMAISLKVLYHNPKVKKIQEAAYLGAKVTQCCHQFLV